MVNTNNPNEDKNRDTENNDLNREPEQHQNTSAGAGSLVQVVGTRDHESARHSGLESDKVSASRGRSGTDSQSDHLSGSGGTGRTAGTGFDTQEDIVKAGSKEEKEDNSSWGSTGGAQSSGRGNSMNTGDEDNGSGGAFRSTESA